MDVRTYYQKIRDMEATIPGQFTVIVSRATDDGGKSSIADAEPPLNGKYDEMV